MPVCTGKGDTDGGHCCWVNGTVCEFLTSDIRCGVWDTMSGPVWDDSPIGQKYARDYPGKTCRDWPQNIPELMAEGVGLCCWRNNGDLG